MRILMNAASETPPAGTSPAPAPAQAAAPAPLAQDQAKLVENAEAFNARLEAAKAAGERSLLKTLGVSSQDEIKAQMLELRQLKESQMSEQERIKKQLDELTPRAKRAEELEVVLGLYAEQQFAELPKEMQGFIAKVAGDDPAARLRAIATARAEGLLKPSAPAAPAAAPEAPRAPNPATTMAPPGPAPVSSAAGPTPYEQWAKLKEEGKNVLAARYRMMNEKAIEASKPR